MNKYDYGWLISNFNIQLPDEYVDFSHVMGKKTEYTIVYKTDGKFSNDRLFDSRESILIATDGVLLNSVELCDSSQKDLYSTIRSEYIENKQKFMNIFNGPYNGFVLDEEKDTITAFTNRIGDRAVYYYYQNHLLLISSNLNMIIKTCQKNNINLNLNESGVNMLLQFGFMLDERTLVEQITRLFPGSSIVFSDNHLSIERYYVLNNDNPINISMEEAIDQLDFHFRNGVKRCFLKDDEYGYKHIADLSGGLDSRMTTWVANNIGYNNVTNLCFSTSGDSEQKIAEQVANVLGNEFIYKSLDDLSFCNDIEEMVYNNYGSAIFCGPTTALRLIKKLNNDDIGLKHTGQVGDAIIGSLLGNAKHEKPHLEKFGYSSGEQMGFELNTKRYKNHEQLLLYSRGFLGATASHLLISPYAIAVSPFLDNDVVDFCMSLPLDYRINHKLYIKWILTKYPKAAKYKWTYTNAKITHNITLTHGLLWLKNRSKQKIKKNLYKIKLTNNPYCKIGMNPTDYLYFKNPRVKKYWGSYFKMNIGLLESHKDISNKLHRAFAKGNFYEKALVLTVLAFTKIHNLGD